MIRRPPRSTLDRSSAASDVYKRQEEQESVSHLVARADGVVAGLPVVALVVEAVDARPVSYTHLRAHQTVLDIVCRLLLAKQTTTSQIQQ